MCTVSLRFRTQSNAAGLPSGPTAPLATGSTWAGTMVALFGGKTMRAVFVRAVPHWRDAMLAAHLRTVARWKEVDLLAASDVQLLDGIRELARAEAIYWAGASAVMAAARGGLGTTGGRAAGAPGGAQTSASSGCRATRGQVANGTF